jgi:hypothetical protein
MMAVTVTQLLLAVVEVLVLREVMAQLFQVIQADLVDQVVEEQVLIQHGQLRQAQVLVEFTLAEVVDLLIT